MCGVLGPDQVLSVIAQQIMTLQGAVMRKETRVIFEDTDIYVDPEFAVFITMNPGRTHICRDYTCYWCLKGRTLLGFVNPRLYTQTHAPPLSFPP